MYVASTDGYADRDLSFAYLKGLLVPWHQTTGLTPDRAWDLARRVEDHLAGSGRDRISLEELRDLAREVLGEAEGDATVERFRRWHEFATLDRPVVVLIGGASGVGKSTVATQLAQHLGITRVSSTDFIRQVLRSVVPDVIAPELSRSSFELDRSHDGAAPHAEFDRQVQQVLVGVGAEIQRAVNEGMSIILEGIHLLPGLVDAQAVTDGLVVEVVLTVEDQDDHERRFAVRAGASGRPAERYDDGLEAIRSLQEYVVGNARGIGTPVIDNRHEDATVRDVLDVVFAAVDGARRTRAPEPAPR